MKHLHPTLEAILMASGKHSLCFYKVQKLGVCNKAKWSTTMWPLGGDTALSVKFQISSHIFFKFISVHIKYHII